jgi:hypothetical protein
MVSPAETTVGIRMFEATLRQEIKAGNRWLSLATLSSELASFYATFPVARRQL